MYDNVIKGNIRRFRKAKGYTQAEMAEILNISVTYYRSIESGNASLLKPVIEDIALVFEVEVEELLRNCMQKSDEGTLSLREESASYVRNRKSEEQRMSVELAQYRLKVPLMEARMREQENHIADLQGAIRILKRAKGFDDSDKI